MGRWVDEKAPRRPVRLPLAVFGLYRTLVDQSYGWRTHSQTLLGQLQSQSNKADDIRDYHFYGSAFSKSALRSTRISHFVWAFFYRLNYL